MVDEKYYLNMEMAYVMPPPDDGGGGGDGEAEAASLGLGVGNSPGTSSTGSAIGGNVGSSSGGNVGSGEANDPSTGSAVTTGSNTTADGSQADEGSTVSGAATGIGNDGYGISDSDAMAASIEQGQQMADDAATIAALGIDASTMSATEFGQNLGHAVSSGLISSAGMNTAIADANFGFSDTAEANFAGALAGIPTGLSAGLSAFGMPVTSGIGIASALAAATGQGMFGGGVEGGDGGAGMTGGPGEPIEDEAIFSIQPVTQVAANIPAEAPMRSFDALIPTLKIGGRTLAEILETIG